MDVKADGECPVSSGTGTSAVISWSGPRTVIVPRTEAGFGFTLRHFIVYPPESSISSQIQDGEAIVDENDPEVRRHKRTKLSDLEPMDTIFVKHVKDDSPAHKAGLNPGDRIVSVNGESVTGKTYSQVIALIQSSDSSLKLLVVPKDEDILQMAYQNTAYNQAAPEIFPDSVSGLSIKHINHHNLPKEPPVYIPERAKDRKVSFTVEETHSFEPIFTTTTTIQEITPCPLVTSASYTSGICLQREPLKNDNMNKTSFLDRKREFEQRASQVPDGKIDSYSFGLYYPPKKDQQKSNSIDNIYITSSSRRRTSRENVLQSRESLENVSRSESQFQTSYNGKEPRHGFSTTLRTISSENKQFPRSRTTSSLSSIANNTTPVSSRIELTPSDHSSNTSTGSNNSGVSTHESSTLGKMHYIPLLATQTPLAPRSLQIASYNRSNQYSCQTSESHNKWPPSGKKEKPELTSPTHGQFVFKATYGTSTGNQNSSPSTTVLPNTYYNRPLVVQRKQQFETNSNNSSNSSSGAATPNSGCSGTMTSTVCIVTPKMLPQTNRYKTEIEKITSRAKFESVASRAAQFETRSSLESIRITPPVFTPPAKIHRISTERTPEQGNKYQQVSERTSTYKASLTKSLSTPTSPSQEMMPVQSDKLLDSYCRYDSTPTVSNSQECYVDEISAPQSDKDFKSIPKANYITTINADINNAENSLLGMSSCTESKDDFFSRANYGGSDVILRKKSDAMSPEHDAVKLQRRTSYLMATARERTELSLPVQHPLDRLTTATHALDSMHTLPHGGHPQTIHAKKPKPATLMEEKSTPSIAEEQQQQQQPHQQQLPTKTELPPQPPSPQFETLKEGNLSCKSAIIDGKRSSDRSWKTYMVLLKGHELYLQDKRKEGNTNSQFLTEMEQPVSIKGSLVEVATDYTKKKYVFRLTTQNGSEFLFQADDSDTMMSWIQAIKTNSEQEDEIRIGDTEATSAPNAKISPQMPSKSSKKQSGLSFRQKITHSPNLRRRKTEEGSKSKSWKGKLDRFKRKGNNTAPVLEKPSGCFGIPLHNCIQSPYKEGVPFMVDLCTRIVEARGLEVVGVYRVPGNKLAISMMQEELNKGIDYINLDNEKWLDVNVISSLLKGFFRKLPDPLVTNELYPSFIKANQIEPAQKRMLTLKRLLHQLPDNHFETFRHLALHLRKVADHSSINKMGARNLAIVLGPTLIRRSDEDVQGMAVDMSHQCRIIERIILHPDWFFSSWDEDCNVPSEENGAAENVPGSTPSPVMNSLASPDGDSLEEAEEINPRDILEDMIAAAHQKLQSSDKKNVDEPDAPLTPSAQYEERDIDAEVAKHQAKTQASLTDLHSNSSQSQLDTISYSSHVTNERKASASSSSIGNDDLMDSGFLSKFHNSPQGIRRHLSRHYSNESLVEKSDELEISHGLNHTYSLSQDTLDSLRALRELDAQRQRESEQRRMESRKIDQEYLRTKEEMEMEEQHSIEDLLNPKTRILSSYTTGYSLTSTPYSTLFDGIDSVFQQPISGKGWLTPSPSSSSNKANEAVGGKYFVSVGNSKMSDKRTYHPAVLDSNKRSNSLEAILDAAQPWCSSPNSRKYCDSESSPLQESDLCLGLGNSLRRGSLDSMIDFYDKHENRLSWESTDSEDGSDLLTSLTTTFDQKLKILLNPNKYKLNSNFRPRSTASSTLPSTSPSSLTSLPPPAMAISHAPTTTMSRYTDAGPISIVNDVTGEERDFNGDAHTDSTRMLNLGLAYSWQAKKNLDMFDSFRDPSLHRSQKSETKIGIASRFTRSNPNPTPHIPGERAIITHGAAPIAASHLASSEYAQRRNNGAGISPDGRVRYLSPISDTPSMPKDYYLHKKKLKTYFDKGGSLGGVNSDNGSSSSKTGFSVLMGRDLMAKADVSPLLSTTVGKVSTSEKHRSTSPPTVPRRKVRGRRRHTVGGSEDMKHFNTLVTLLSGKEESERVLSAWERLRPFSKASEMYEQLPLAWLNKNSQQNNSSEFDCHVQPILERTVRKV